MGFSCFMCLESLLLFAIRAIAATTLKFIIHSLFLYGEMYYYYYYYYFISSDL